MKNNSYLKLSVNNWVNYLSVIFFYFLVDWIFINEYRTAYTYIPTSSIYKIESILSVIIFSIIPIFFLPKKIDVPSSVICWLLYFLSYLPTAFIYIYFTGSIFEYLQLMIILLVSIAIFRFTILIKIRFKQRRKINFLYLDYVFFFSFFLFLIIYLWSLSDFNIDLNPENVYKRRLAARDNYGYMGYFIALIKSAFLVFSVYLFLIKRKILYLSLALIGVFGIYAFDGTKTPIILFLALIFYGFLFYYISKTSPKPTTLFLSLIAACLGSWVLLVLFDSPLLIDFFVRRVFIIPGVMNGYYFDYFQFFPNIFNPPQNVSYIIGDIYFGKDYANASTGIWMNAFARYGLFGVFFISFISGLTAIFLDSMIEKNNRLLGLLIGIMVGFTWSEQAFATSIFSGGIFFYLILLLWISSSTHLKKYFS